MKGKGLSGEELRLLLKQVEMIKNSFNFIRQEARDILEASNIKDAKANLQDVLQHSENATVGILNNATEINAIAIGPGVSPEAKAALLDKTTKIFESCAFQDITGQRLKRIAKQLSAIEQNLEGIVNVASKPVREIADQQSSLMSGPQLSGNTPSQAEIDAMMQEA